MRSDSLPASAAATTASKPFGFVTVALLTRISNQMASNLAELLVGLEQCSDASIFNHTFQTLGTHHFLTEGFSNDFAQWVYAATNREELAEQLAAIDIRDYVGLAELRSDLRRILGDYCRENPQLAQQTALERFYFCESVEATAPLGVEAHNLMEFRDAVAQLAHASFYFHFIISRLRLHLQTNDFSHWLQDSLGLSQLASNINRIDIYTNTLDGIRARMLRLIDRELSRT
jgi:Family of unknown function (DUF5752)